MKMQTTNSRGALVLLLVTVAGLCFPLVIFTVSGTPVHLTLFLVPLAIFTWAASRGRIALWLAVALAAGFFSILIAWLVDPDGASLRNILSLAVIVATASFLFIGMLLVRMLGMTRVLLILSIASAIFVILIAARILILRESVRIFVGPLGAEQSILNAEIFLQPVFGAFGILSLTFLIALQVIIICGGFLVEGLSRPLRVLLWVGALLGSYLVWGSASRSAQIVMIFIICAVILFYFVNRNTRLATIFLLVATVLGIGLSSQNASVVERLLITGGQIGEVINPNGYSPNGDSPNGNSPNASPINGVDTLSSGRLTLALQAVEEVLVSPVFGNGFAHYGRFNETANDSSIGINTSTHIYYLTLIWKGGLLFLIPFSFVLILALRAAFTRRSRGEILDPALFFGRTAVIAAFAIMPFSWDILLVPSAGALAFFLVGTLVNTSLPAGARRGHLNTVA